MAKDGNANPPMNSDGSDAGGGDAGYGGGLSRQGRHQLLRECEALVLYVARHAETLDGSGEGQAAYERLVRLVDGGGGRDAAELDWPALIEAYAGVTRVTNAACGVNGRSVLDTLNAFGEAPRPWWDPRRWLGLLLRPRRCQRLMAVAIWLAALGFLLQVFVGWTARAGDPDALTGAWRALYFGGLDLLPLIVPAVSGGMGSCVFLMKLISDKLSAFTYEEARLRGDGTRIFLGAILGVLVDMLFFPEFTGQIAAGGASLGPVALAFVAGLSVNAVYSAFERFVEGVAGAVFGGGRR